MSTKTETTEQSKNATIVGPVRLSYLNVYKPRENKMKGEEEYSVTLLIPKKPTSQCPNPKAVVKSIADSIKTALDKKFATKPAKWDNPLRDGDTETDADGAPRNPGCWFLNVRCGKDYPPVLVDAKREMVTAQMGWKSGDWGKVQISCYGYEFQGKKGVGAGLRAIQFLYSDEALGSVADPVAVANNFDIEEGDSPRAGSAPATDEYDPFADE